MKDLEGGISSVQFRFSVYMKPSEWELRFGWSWWRSVARAGVIAESKTYYLF